MTFSFKWPQRKKARGERSGDRAGHSTSPSRETGLPGKWSRRSDMFSLMVWHVAPFCWKWVSTWSISSTWGMKKSMSMFWYRSPLTATDFYSSLKNKGHLCVPALKHMLRLDVQSVTAPPWFILDCYPRKTSGFADQRFRSSLSASSEKIDPPIKGLSSSFWRNHLQNCVLLTKSPECNCCQTWTLYGRNFSFFFTSVWVE